MEDKWIFQGFIQYALGIQWKHEEYIHQQGPHAFACYIQHGASIPRDN